MKKLLIIVLCCLMQATQPAWVSKDTKNFKILSTDSKTTSYLYDNVEFIKEWCCGRWYLNDIDFSKKCCLVSTQTKEEYFNIFQKTYPEISFSTEFQGQNISAVWFWSEKDNWRSSVLPKYMTIIILHEHELKNNVKYSFVAKTGMACLNSEFKFIKERISLIKGEKYTVRELLAVNGQKLSADKNSNYPKYENFEGQSAVLSLFIAKKYGLDVYKRYLRGEFDGTEEFFENYEKYQNGLIKGLSNDTIDKSYVLKIFK